MHGGGSSMEERMDGTMEERTGGGGMQKQRDCDDGKASGPEYSSWLVEYDQVQLRKGIAAVQTCRLTQVSQGSEY